VDPVNVVDRPNRAPGSRERRGGGPETTGSGERLLHLLAATGIAVSQPLYDVMQRNPEFAIAHRLGAWDLVAVAASLSLGPALAIWLPLAGVALRHRRAAWWCQCAAVGALLGTVPLALLRHTSAPLAARLALLALSAFLAALAYHRNRPLRGLLAAVSVGAIAFPALFLWQVRPRPAVDRAPAAVAGPAIAAPATWSGRGPRPPVVLIVLDELPLASLLADVDTIDAARFPNFAALAARSYWFRRATAVAQSTSMALPPIVTGRYPSGKTPPTAEGHPDNLFTWLQGRYALHVVETTTALCGPACRGVTEAVSPGSAPGPGAGERLRRTAADLTAVFLAGRLPQLGPVVTEGWSDYWSTGPRGASVSATRGAGTRSGETADPLAGFLDALATTPRQTLHFLHLPLPHVPWQFLPDGRTYRRKVGDAVHGLRIDGRWGADEWEVTQGQQRHLLQLQYVDRLLGRLVRQLEELDLFDESLIIVTADHGAAFRAGDRRRVLTDTNLAEIAHVPLLIKVPGQVEGRRDDRNVETVDIAPTVAERIGLRLRGPLDGRSVFAEPRLASTPKTIFRSWLHGGAGEPWHFSAARLDATRESVERENRRFPEPSLYVVGAHRGLLGRAVAELARRPVEPRAGATATLEAPHAFDDVDPEATRLPVHVMGRLDLARPAESQQHLALVLDGVVRAESRTYCTLPASRLRFTALLDPAALHRGRQRLEIFLVDAAGELTPVPIAGQ
jgi:Sulfatase